MKAAACHNCCPPSVVVRIMKPIMGALMDSRTRLRLMHHDASESELIKILSEYGIQKDVLPSEMGGSYEFNPYEWIASRRAAEMALEEIS